MSEQKVETSSGKKKFLLIAVGVLLVGLALSSLVRNPKSHRTTPPGSVASE